MKKGLFILLIISLLSPIMISAQVYINDEPLCYFGGIDDPCQNDAWNYYNGTINYYYNSHLLTIEGFQGTIEIINEPNLIIQSNSSNRFYGGRNPGISVYNSSILLSGIFTFNSGMGLLLNNSQVQVDGTLNFYGTTPGSRLSGSQLYLNGSNIIYSGSGYLFEINNTSIIQNGNIQINAGGGVNFTGGNVSFTSVNATNNNSNINFLKGSSAKYSTSSTTLTGYTNPINVANSEISGKFIIKNAKESCITAKSNTRLNNINLQCNSDRIGIQLSNSFINNGSLLVSNASKNCITAQDGSSIKNAEIQCTSNDVGIELDYSTIDTSKLITIKAPNTCISSLGILSSNKSTNSSIIANKSFKCSNAKTGIKYNNSFSLTAKDLSINATNYSIMGYSQKATISLVNDYKAFDDGVKLDDIELKEIKGTFILPKNGQINEGVTPLEVSVKNLSFEPSASILIINSNGGTGEMENMYISQNGTNIKNVINNITPPEGMRFKGWSYTSNGPVINNLINIHSTTDNTIYAIWEEIPKEPEPSTPQNEEISEESKLSENNETNNNEEKENPETGTFLMVGLINLAIIFGIICSKYLKKKSIFNE